MAGIAAKRITKQMLKNESREFDVESIHTLDLHGRGISDLGCLSQCSGLERLDLSWNSITSIDLLMTLTNLVYLDLSSNQISVLVDLHHLEHLSFLNLAGNLIRSVDAVCHCLSDLLCLTELRLKDVSLGLSNPVCDSPTYIHCICSSLSHLVILDGERLESDGTDTSQMCADIDNMIQECKSLWQKIETKQVQDFSSAEIMFQLPDILAIGSQPAECVTVAQRQLDDVLNGCEKMLQQADDYIKHNSSCSELDACQNADTEQTDAATLL
jgi:Leucine-rich repeat (LRR) protein